MPYVSNMELKNKLLNGKFKCDPKMHEIWKPEGGYMKQKSLRFNKILLKLTEKKLNFIYCVTLMHSSCHFLHI